MALVLHQSMSEMSNMSSSMEMSNVTNSCRSYLFPLSLVGGMCAGQDLVSAGSSAAFPLCA